MLLGLKSTVRISKAEIFWQTVQLGLQFALLDSFFSTSFGKKTRLRLIGLAQYKSKA
eukprot:m.439034 g.439034  ORF g.439034 m.439034 type:complete len:57 (-) comp18323_c0_seq1:1249-1419(-)